MRPEAQVDGLARNSPSADRSIGARHQNCTSNNNSGCVLLFGAVKSVCRSLSLEPVSTCCDTSRSALEIVKWRTIHFSQNDAGRQLPEIEWDSWDSQAVRTANLFKFFSPQLLGERRGNPYRRSLQAIGGNGGSEGNSQDDKVFRCHRLQTQVTSQHSHPPESKAPIPPLFPEGPPGGSGPPRLSHYGHEVGTRVLKPFEKIRKRVKAIDTERNGTRWQAFAIAVVPRRGARAGDSRPADPDAIRSAFPVQSRG